MNDDELKQLQKLEQQIHQLEALVQQKMSKEAWSRYNTLKVAHADKAIQAIAIMAQLIQQGKITKQLTDEEFKGFLMQVTEPKRETKIRYA